MAVDILAIGNDVPSSRVGAIPPIFIPIGTPIPLASFTMDIDADAPLNNRVELNTTVGVSGTDSIPQIIFKIFRDGDLIFSTQQGIQIAEEQFYPVKFTAIDFNVPQGSHTYTLTVERSIVGGGSGTVAGPIIFGGIAFGPVA